jgi:hypothetical protein
MRVQNFKLNIMVIVTGLPGDDKRILFFGRSLSGYGAGWDGHSSNTYILVS